MTTQTTEERVSRLEGAYEQVNERLSDLRAELHEQIGSVRTEVGALRSEMNSRFNALLLMIAGLWATMIGGFIALFVNG